MYVKLASECSQRERDDFVALVSNGGHSVPQVNLERVKLIGFVYEGDLLISARCLKQPFLSYKRRVFKAAQMESYSSFYFLESGYSHTLERFRRFGLSTTLLKKLLRHSSIRRHNVFGTTLMHNTPIIKCYLKVGAKPIGKPFCSPNGMVLVWRLK